MSMEGVSWERANQGRGAGRANRGDRQRRTLLLAGGSGVRIPSPSLQRAGLYGLAVLTWLTNPCCWMQRDYPAVQR